MKRNIGLILCIIFVLGILVGCSNFSGHKDGENDKKAKNQTLLDTEKESKGSKDVEGVDDSSSEKQVDKSDMNNLEDLKKSKYTELNKLEGVSMDIEEGTVTPVGLTVIFNNITDKEYIFGQHYLLETKIDGDWYELPTIIDNYGFEDIAFILSPDDQAEWSTDWEWLYGSLEPGEYRIIKDIIDFRDTGDFDELYMAAEFTIKN